MYRALVIRIETLDVLTYIPPEEPTELSSLGQNSSSAQACLSHCRLSRIPRDIARSEVERSRAVLDATLGQDTRLISFPYGDHDGAVADLCEKAGYEFMYSIEPVPVNPRSLDRVRGRVSVSPDDSLLEIYLKSAGGYRWMPVASAIKRWIRRGRS